MLLMYSRTKSHVGRTKNWWQPTWSAFFLSSEFNLRDCFLFSHFFQPQFHTLFGPHMVVALCIAFVCPIVIIIFNSIEIMVPFSGNLSTCFFHVMFFFVVPHFTNESQFGTYRTEKINK